MRQRKTLQAVIDLYGADHQLAKTVEELTELIHVTARRLQSGQWDRTALYEELADVHVMLEQMKLICCAEMDMTLQEFNNKLDAQKRMKLKRTIQRMQEEEQ